MSGQGLHTNQIGPLNQALEYEAGVSPSAIDDAADREYVLQQAALIKEVEDDVSGDVDGVETIFNTTQAYRSGTVVVEYNGLELDPDDVTESGAQEITLASAPAAGNMIIRYRPDATLPAGHPNLTKTRVILGSTKISIAEADDSLMLVDTSTGNMTVQLPIVGASEEGLHVRFVNIGANQLTLSCVDGKDIEGSSSRVLAQDEGIELVYTHQDSEWSEIINTKTLVDNAVPEAFTSDPDIYTSPTGRASAEADVVSAITSGQFTSQADIHTTITSRVSAEADVTVPPVTFTSLDDPLYTLVEED